MNIKDLVAPGNRVKFTRYFDGQLWYEVVEPPVDGHSERLLEFPVPVSDIGNATFHAEDKAILFMRYIRKHLELLEEAKLPHCGYCHQLLTKCTGHLDGHNA